MVVACAGVVEAQLLSEGDQRVLDEPFAIRPVFPKVHEEVVPSLNERISFARSNEMVGSRDAIHPWDGHLERRIWVFQLVPANAIKMPNKNVPNVHEDAAMMIQARPSKQVASVRALVRTIHRPLHEGLR
jgi:hypothetical protein